MPPKTKKKTRSILKMDSFDEEQTIAPDCRCISTSLGLSHLHFSLHNFLTFPSFPHFSHPSTDFSHPQTKNLHPLGWRQQRIKLYQFGSLHIDIGAHVFPVGVGQNLPLILLDLQVDGYTFASAIIQALIICAIVILFVKALQYLISILMTLYMYTASALLSLYGTKTGPCFQRLVDGPEPQRRGQKSIFYVSLILPERCGNIWK